MAEYAAFKISPSTPTSQKDLVSSAVDPHLEKITNLEERDALKELLAFLFTSFQDYEELNTYRTRLQYFIPLRTVLKKGIDSKAVSRSEITEFLQSDHPTKHKKLLSYFDDERMEDFIAAFFRFFHSGYKVDEESLVEALLAFDNFFDYGYEDSNFDPEFRISPIVKKFVFNLTGLSECSPAYNRIIQEFSKNIAGGGRPDEVSVNLLSSILVRAVAQEEQAEYLIEPYNQSAIQNSAIEKYQSKFRKQEILPGLRTDAIFALLLNAHKWDEASKKGLTADLESEELFFNFIQLLVEKNNWGIKSIVELLDLGLKLIIVLALISTRGL